MDFKIFCVSAQMFGFVFFVLMQHTANGDVIYSFPEEMKRGSVIGNLVKDLGLDVNMLSFRKPRIDTEGNRKRFCEINLNSGELTVAERIDREALCGKKASCVMKQELVLENPLELHRFVLNIQDINDMTPIFKQNLIKFEIRESADKGSRYLLEEAHDADIGVNSVQSYTLQSNDHFLLNVVTRENGRKYGELVLNKELDREQQKEVTLILTAVDGGTPPRSGTVVIHVTVLDANDNAPVFSQAVYKVSLPENSPVDTVVVTVSATDADEGQNGEVTYAFGHLSENFRQLFFLDVKSGEIKVVGNIDYEEKNSIELPVQAKDGQGLAGRSIVLLDVVDVNDNAPIIIIKSLNSPVPENASPGTEVGIINVQDRDSENNGQVRCSIHQNIPFKLVPSIKNYYSLVTTGELDRELVSDYNITITATDKGSPPLSSIKNVHFTVADVNDNPPVFEEQNYRAHLSESDSMKQNLIVSVRDNGQPSLSYTCALFLLISDNLAEVPELKDMSHDESSSKLTFYLIIALVSVSTFFLTFIIIILAVRFCRRRKPRLLFDGAVAIPSAYLPPNYAEVEGAGTLRSAYNYDAYLTTGSRTSDFKFVRSYNEGTMTADLTLKNTQSAFNDLEGLDAEIVDSFKVVDHWLKKFGDH
ncbi:putative protocadherin gamma-A11-like [Triplophysa rosa]|uniref:Protocadherin gamma-A11-like n=1 Tax=Triplophysa rosa TaxID=992332 RepID=A0A9W7TQC3_TRIRA|nr:putative protocadherin gamma-A11-like [Triplophysa rosa]